MTYVKNANLQLKKVAAGDRYKENLRFIEKKSLTILENYNGIQIAYYFAYI